MGMPSPATVALAVVLASCRGEPRLDGKRLVIWRDVRGVLDRYGIKYKYYTCRFEYRRRRVDPAKAQRDEKLRLALKRRKRQPSGVRDGFEVVGYARVKVVVQDYEVATKAIEILRDPKRARTVFARYGNIAKDVMLSLRSIAVSAKRYFARWTLRKIFSLFNTWTPTGWRRPYEKYLSRALVREILPNWRGSRYKMFLLCKPYMLSSL